MQAHRRTPAQHPSQSGGRCLFAGLTWAARKTIRDQINKNDPNKEYRGPINGAKCSYEPRSLWRRGRMSVYVLFSYRAYMTAELYVTIFLSPSDNPSQTMRFPPVIMRLPLLLHPVPPTASSRWLHSAARNPSLFRACPPFPAVSNTPKQARVVKFPLQPQTVNHCRMVFQVFPVVELGSTVWVWAVDRFSR